MKKPAQSTSQNNPPFITQSTDGALLIDIRLQPRSSRNRIEGVSNGALKVRLTAPPVEGEANRALIEFLSKTLDVRKSAITIESGLKSRDKKVRVEGAARETAEERLVPDRDISR